MLNKTSFISTSIICYYHNKIFKLIIIYIMAGFPYTYGDTLSVFEAKENQKSFFKKYGSVIILNSALFILTSTANAQECPAVPKNGVVETPKPTPSPIFKPVLPPSGVVNSKCWSVGGIGAIAWICITAAATGDPSLVFACASLVNYAIGKK